MIDAPPRKRHPDKAAVRAQQWAAVPLGLRQTLQGYIEQTRMSLRPATMVLVEAVLREFASWLTTDAPEVAAVVDLRRDHIERYKRHLAERPARCSARLSKIGLAEHLGTLRVCLERLAEWDGDDAPARVLMFAGDIPRRDEPLPPFIDDAAAAKLLRAAREQPDPFTRLAVEFLGPHRPSQERVPRPHRRLRRADRRRVLAARPAREAAHRPLHPLGPAAQRDARRLGRAATGRAARAVAFI